MAAMALSNVSNAKAVRKGGVCSFGARRGGEERSTASGVGRSGVIEGYSNGTGIISCKWTAVGAMTVSKKMSKCENCTPLTIIMCIWLRSCTCDLSCVLTVPE